MQKMCKDCRFYQNGRCSTRRRVASGVSLACPVFSAYSERDQKELRYCKDCRFFSGDRCLETNRSVNALGSKCYRASICR